MSGTARVMARQATMTLDRMKRRITRDMDAFSSPIRHTSSLHRRSNLPNNHTTPQMRERADSGSCLREQWVRGRKTDSPETFYDHHHHHHHKSECDKSW